MGKFTLRKSERLSREKDIQELFTKGSYFYLYPFKILWQLSPHREPSFHQVLISVSKKHFRKAVDRNHVKRRIREAYRLNKQLLPPAPFLQLGFIYTQKEIMSTEEFFVKMVHALKKVRHVTEGNSKSS